MVNLVIECQKKLSRYFVLLSGLEPANGFRCAQPCDLENATFDIPGLNNSFLFPMDSEDETKFDFCQPFQYIGKSKSNGCAAEDFNQSNPIDFQSCDKILYADFAMDSTIVTDLDLVCDKQFQVSD